MASNEIDSLNRYSKVSGQQSTGWLAGDGVSSEEGPRSQFRRVSKVSELLAREILEYILAHRLGPGTKLPSEAAMLEEYGAGRASLREALHILEAYGLITIRPGKGGGPVIEDVGPRDFARLMTFYMHVKRATFAELLASSQLMQTAMVAQAAARRDRKQIRVMRSALKRAETSLGDSEFGRAMYDFYHAMYDVPGGEVLAMIRDALHEIVSLQVGRRIPFEEVRAELDDHHRLVDAIAAGDGGTAQRLLEEHSKKIHVIYEDAIPGILAERVPWI